MGLIDKDVRRTGSRDVWSHGEGHQLRELISSALLTLLLVPSQDRSAYFSSPWMSDFVLFDNKFRQVGSLFPEIADKSTIRFSDFLRHLSAKMQVRIVTSRTDTSISFLRHLE